MLDFAARMIAPLLHGSTGAPPRHGAPSMPSLGLVAGTKVATNIGWRAVDAVAVGDRVLTFDAGLQEVIAVERFAVAPDLHGSLWPLRVPAGALGNQSQMILLAEQLVVPEADCAEDVFGDPFALIPAAALDDFRGIERIAPDEIADVVTLSFAEDQVVFANLGALFYCPSHRSNALDRLLNDPSNASYRPLPLAVAESLVDLISLEETATRAA